MLPPEFEFLCYLVRPEPDHKRASELAHDGLDWTLVANLAAAHSVRPHLLHTLNDNAWGGSVIDLKLKLNSFQRAHMVRNLNLTGELLGIAGELNKRGI